MRDRLIELIAESAIKGDYTCIPDVADYLLANGVIVPPCNVGQTIYYNCCGKIYEGKCHAITIHDGNRIQVHLYDFDGDNASYSSKDIYTSREEAEKALKDGKGEGE